MSQASFGDLLGTCPGPVGGREVNREHYSLPREGRRPWGFGRSRKPSQRRWDWIGEEDSNKQGARGRTLKIAAYT